MSNNAFGVREDAMFNRMEIQKTNHGDISNNVLIVLFHAIPINRN